MNRFAKKLKQLKSQNRLRSLNLPHGIDLTSNDYLGLRTHPALRQGAVEALEAGIDLGAGGSRLLRGHTQHHESLETYAAEFFGSEKSLYFPTGFQANYALFSTLPSRHDIIVFDEHIHASARDGIAASHAKTIKAKHNDLQAFEDALIRAQKQRRENGQIWLVIDSLYSMGGDLAPVNDLYILAQKYEAMLVIDEAHATGVLGPQGRGLAFALAGDENVITMHACGKALGVAGGLVCGSSDVIDTLINVARPFIFSTAPPPLQAHMTQKALELVAGEEGDNLRASLSHVTHYVKLNLGGSGVLGRDLGGLINVGGWDKREPTHIVPIILGSDEKAVHVASILQQAGYDIRAIRPPTVPEGTARLRLALSVNLDETLLASFLRLLKA